MTVTVPKRLARAAALPVVALLSACAIAPETTVDAPAADGPVLAASRVGPPRLGPRPLDRSGIDAAAESVFGRPAGLSGGFAGPAARTPPPDGLAERIVRARARVEAARAREDKSG